MQALLRRFSRQTTSGRLIPEMDGLRFVAISLVILFHLNGYLAGKCSLHGAGALQQSGWLAQTAQLGFHGVELFFIISGFILALPFAASHLGRGAPVSLQKYYLRRLTRLEPPYIVTALSLFLLTLWFQEKSAAALYPHLLASLCYLHNMIYGSPSAVLGVAWSLEIEVQFYLLLPLPACLFAIRSRWLRRSVLLAVISGFVAAQSVLGQSARVSLSILAYAQFFLIGFLLADIYLTDWEEAPVTGPYWDGLTIIGWPALFLLLRSEPLTHWLFPFLAFALCYAAFRGFWTRWLFSNRWITTAGGMCYSIYLIHYDIISLAGRFTRQIGEHYPYALYLSIQGVLIGIPILLICSLYFLVLEKPCMDHHWPARVFNRVTSLAPIRRGEAVGAD